MQYLSKPEYNENIANSRDRRMAWWRDARYGLFIHYGLYSVLGSHEWAMALEGWPVDEYEKIKDQFNPKPGVARQWAMLAKAAGMKYMVLTTRHHEGFSLWDSKANSFNSVNYGAKRDIVREFVDACREYDLKIGFYSSLMDWHHPDGGRAAYDSAARMRFNDYIDALNKELLTQYGKIDILWYDMPSPMEHAEGWNSLERNQRLRAIQPDLIINPRSKLDEDYDTPEERIAATERDWESCMTFNGISWGYVDSEQARPYSYTAQQILRMLCRVTYGGGNLLLNIGPTPDGSIPPEAIEPLKTVGRWLEKNGETVYGKKDRRGYVNCHGLSNSVVKDNTLYLWNWIWNSCGELRLGGFSTKLKKAAFLANGQPIAFRQEKYRIILEKLPEKAPDDIAGVTVIKLEFEEAPKYTAFINCPALNNGRAY